MIANLPLLFANGNPTALSKITAPELERFITFMVTCSWGHDTAKDIRQPPWWPDDVEFSHPFQTPLNTSKDWATKLKRLVKKCYDYHKSTFLLVFSAQLARYSRNRLRYVDNHDHTTSLYYKPSGKLLVTFRNENMNYDQCGGSPPPEPPPRSANIYLCDNCDSHFDNLEIFRAHERLCNNEGIPTSSIGGGLPEFLSALKLKPLEDSEVKSVPLGNEGKPRNSRNATNIDRGPPYPFSSLAYIKNAKTHCPRDLTHSRERVERYCSTAPNPLGKSLGINRKGAQFPVRYRRPIDYWHRKHLFPCQRNKEVIDLKGQLLLLKCRPVTVKVERMSSESMQEYIESLQEKHKQEELQDPLQDCEVIDLCSDDESSSAVTCVVSGGAVLRRAPVATAQCRPSEPCGARDGPLLSAMLHPHSPHSTQPHPVILFTHSLGAFQTISID